MRDDPRRMRARDLRRHCLSFPGAQETFPFNAETSVFKVAGRMFALSRLDDRPLTVSVKCEPQVAEQLRAAHPEVAPGYHLNKRHWNTVTVDGALPASMVRDMIEDSYDLVVSGLPAATRRALGWAPEEPGGAAATADAPSLAAAAFAPTVAAHPPDRGAEQDSPHAVTAEVWRHPGEAGWHFITLPDGLADRLRAEHAGRHRPFGSLPVRATLGDTTWTTSLFADRRSGSYLLPLKADVRRREHVAAGQAVTIAIAAVD